MRSRSFDDRTVDLRGAPEQLAEVARLLSSPTRLAILNALMSAGEPLSINAVARRVGVDASPVRTHLELLEKEGLVREEKGLPGRARLFTTRLTGARLTLEGVNRAEAPEGADADDPPKEAVKLQRKLESLERQVEKRVAQARELQRELERVWASQKRG